MSVDSFKHAESQLCKGLRRLPGFTGKYLAGTAGNLSKDLDRIAAMAERIIHGYHRYIKMAGRPSSAQEAEAYDKINAVLHKPTAVFETRFQNIRNFIDYELFGNFQNLVNHDDQFARWRPVMTAYAEFMRDLTPGWKPVDNAWKLSE